MSLRYRVTNGPYRAEGTHLSFLARDDGRLMLVVNEGQTGSINDPPPKAFELWRPGTYVIDVIEAPE